MAERGSAAIPKLRHFVQARPERTSEYHARAQANDSSVAFAFEVLVEPAVTVQAD